MIIETFGQRWSVSLAIGCERLEAVIRDAEQQVAARGRRLAGLSTRVGGLVCGNVRLIAAALVLIHQRALAGGRRFCEWGCGLGGATCVAGALGLEARGIDIDGELVECSRALARRHGLPAHFEVADYRAPVAGSGGSPAAPDWAAADIVHVYPWPAEAVFLEQLFLQRAPDHALLLSSYGPGEVRLHRKEHLEGRGIYARRRPPRPATRLELAWP